MKQYNFTTVEIEEMYNNVCEECSNMLHCIATGLKEDYSKMDILIKIGDNQVSIPNTADNMEIIFGAIKDCEEYTYCAE